jgi:hypothetical protein
LFGGGGFTASTTLTSYSFIGATVTSTVLPDPTAGGLAACLPAGYVVCWSMNQSFIHLSHWWCAVSLSTLEI